MLGICVTRKCGSQEDILHGSKDNSDEIQDT
jgi:hypothetical protein